MNKDSLKLKTAYNKKGGFYGEGWKPATIRARVNQINRRNEDE